MTVTWESVFCTVTATSTADAASNQRRDEGCSTRVFSTITACSVTASTFTSTTTVLPSQTARPGCGPNTCGNGKTCGVKQHLGKRAVPRTTEPGICHWAGPESYANPADFMASEGNLGSSRAMGTENSKIVPLPEDGKTSSEVVGFFDKPVSLAVPHLVGCTSIIVVSRKGAWANHIWELPVFRPEEDDESGAIKYALPGTLDFTEDDFPAMQQLAFFKTEALDKLHKPYDPVTPEHQFGLDDLKGSDKPKDEAWQGHLFDADSDPQVFAFIPYVTIDDEADPNYMVEHPQNLPAAWDRHDLRNPRADQNGDTFNDMISAELKSIFGEKDLPIRRVLYAPDVEDFEDAGFNSHRGRALIQYQPADDSCDSKARWRIWFEGQVDAPTEEKEWSPLDERGGEASAQLCGGGGNNQRRQACSVSTTVSITTTTSVIDSTSSELSTSITISQTITPTVVVPVTTATASSSDSVPTTTATPTVVPTGGGDPFCQTLTFEDSSTAVLCS
ncbi:hypothetical protein F4808DRAFT_421278 [Astrocystis sublimbata]|nr:hypothetical protein F4808DRAFT_421278 [Astrocystis sublimbata]